MSKPYMEDIIQNMDQTREVPVRKLPFWKNLFKFNDPAFCVMWVMFFTPAALTFWIIGDGLVFRGLLFIGIGLWLALTKAYRMAPAKELEIYHKARGNEPLTREQIQALGLSARFTYRDMGWYHTLEVGAFILRNGTEPDPVDAVKKFEHMTFHFSDKRAEGLKRDWGVSSRSEILDLAGQLCFGHGHRTGIVDIVNQEGFDKLYHRLTRNSDLSRGQLHQLIFEDDEDAEGVSLFLKKNVLSRLEMTNSELEKVVSDILEDHGAEREMLPGGIDFRAEIHCYARQIGRETIKSDLKNIFNMPPSAIDYIFKPQGRHGIVPLAWGFDICRGVFIVRLAYMAGYLTRDEAWKELENFRLIASEVFDSWESFFCSEVIGYYTWYSGHSDREETLVATRKVANDILGALGQGFPINNMVDWPEPSAASRAVMDGLIAQEGANPFYRPELLVPGLAVVAEPVVPATDVKAKTLH
ncbi:DUF1266 domain-containing protein [Roseibium sp. RKSG952]|uniref:DUF1266 domain-containing protein n=1 Tax=Roseibium sp. RKSG952 TaxID=2529384 RepID=UPI0012BC4FB0|nr:DUF1266 domain-containing protein [Roseibium sp. RKSG952]MTH96300.1 DUF1266 domain-containing protein [Roseibium sp. RKSG952]